MDVLLGHLIFFHCTNCGTVLLQGKIVLFSLSSYLSLYCSTVEQRKEPKLPSFPIKEVNFLILQGHPFNQQRGCFSSTYFGILTVKKSFLSSLVTNIMPKCHCQVIHQINKILCQLSQNLTTDCLLNHMFGMCYFTSNCFDPIRRSDQSFAKVEVLWTHYKQ